MNASTAELKGRLIRTLAVCALLGHWLCEGAFATPPAPMKMFYLGVAAPRLKVNSDIELQVVYHQPPIKEMPRLVVQLTLPKESEIIFTSIGERTTTGNSQTIVWTEGPSRDGERHRIKLRLTSAGFYKIQAEVRLDSQDSETGRFVQPYLGFAPESLYLQVSDKGGRVEEWDFSTGWKRFRHWLKSKSRPRY